jgi:hypothetical protein
MKDTDPTEVKTMKTIVCPVNGCNHNLANNFMVFTIHLGKHAIAYAEARDKWFELKKQVA